MGCTFCATGGMGFQGNLTAGEILEQVWHVERAAPTLGCHWRVSNVVFMGMGEPLNNYRPVLAALHGLVELWAMPPHPDVSFESAGKTAAVCPPPSKGPSRYWDWANARWSPTK